MTDTSVKKLQSSHSPKGPEGQKYLASGTNVSMRLWEGEPQGKTPSDTRREYETVGYVLEGHAQLHTEGQIVDLQKGDSWVVPPDAKHHYEFLEPFSAVEATSPPARVHARDEE